MEEGEQIIVKEENKWLGNNINSAKTFMNIGKLSCILDSTPFC